MASELTALHERYTALMEERNELAARVRQLEDGIRKAMRFIDVPLSENPDSVSDAYKVLAALLPQEKSDGK